MLSKKYHQQAYDKVAGSWNSTFAKELKLEKLISEMASKRIKLNDEYFQSKKQSMEYNLLNVEAH